MIYGYFLILILFFIFAYIIRKCLFHHNNNNNNIDNIQRFIPQQEPQINNNVYIFNDRDDEEQISIAMQLSQQQYNQDLKQNINNLEQISLKKHLDIFPNNNTLSLDENNKYTCSICYEIIDIEENIYLIPCKHILHKKCLEEIADNKPICPFCRENLF
jgi:hypothetical protein